MKTQEKPLITNTNPLTSNTIKCNSTIALMQYNNNDSVGKHTTPYEHMNIKLVGMCDVLEINKNKRKQLRSIKSTNIP